MPKNEMVADVSEILVSAQWQQSERFHVQSTFWPPESNLKNRVTEDLE